MDPITLTVIGGGLYLANKFKKKFGATASPSVAPHRGAVPHLDGYCWLAVPPAQRHMLDGIGAVSVEQFSEVVKAEASNYPRHSRASKAFFEALATVLLAEEKYPGHLVVVYKAM